MRDRCASHIAEELHRKAARAVLLHLPNGGSTTDDTRLHVFRGGTLPTGGEERVARHTARVLTANLTLACDWLRELGVPASRIEAQRDLAARVTAGHEEWDRPEAWQRLFPSEEDRRAAWTLLAEAVETQQIYFGLREIPGAIPTHVLKAWANGEVAFDSETSRGSSHQARDAAFELVMFTLFRQAGLAPQYSEPDVVLHVGTRTCLVACKRPQKRRTVNSLFKDACDQIVRESRCVPDREPAFGLVAVSLSKLYDDVPIELDSSADIEEHWQYVTRFRDERWQLWHSRPDAKLGGVLFHLLRPAYDLQQHLFVQRQYASGVGLHFGGASATAATTQITRRLEAVARAIRSGRPPGWHLPRAVVSTLG